jgi:hypothetical protein
MRNRSRFGHMHSTNRVTHQASSYGCVLPCARSQPGARGRRVQQTPNRPRKRPEQKPYGPEQHHQQDQKSHHSGETYVRCSTSKVSLCKGKTSSQTKSRKFNNLHDLKMQHKTSAHCAAFRLRIVFTITYNGQDAAVSVCSSFFWSPRLSPPSEGLNLRPNRLFIPPECDQCPYTGATLRVLIWTHPPADNFRQ